MVDYLLLITLYNTLHLITHINANSYIPIIRVIKHQDIFSETKNYSSFMLILSQFAFFFNILLDFVYNPKVTILKCAPC